MFEKIGYKPLTTFWQDFSIADNFGETAVKDTYQRVFKEWKHDYKYLTELVMVLNHKMWQFYHQGDEPMTRLYNRLWEGADAYAINNLKGEELEYFYKVTD